MKKEWTMKGRGRETDPKKQNTENAKFKAAEEKMKRKSLDKEENSGVETFL